MSKGSKKGHILPLFNTSYPLMLFWAHGYHYKYQYSLRLNLYDQPQKSSTRRDILFQFLHFIPKLILYEVFLFFVTEPDRALENTSNEREIK